MTRLARMRRANRLRTSEEFSSVFRFGARARAGGVVAIGVLHSGGEPKVGIACSRKVGNAVTRNRVKRRLRAAIDALLPEMAPGARVVVQATRDAVPEDFQKLTADVRDGMKRVGAIDG